MFLTSESVTLIKRSILVKSKRCHCASTFGNSLTKRSICKSLQHTRCQFHLATLTIAATYVVYTYITPLLENMLLIPARYISLILLIYGIASIISTLLAGKIAVRNGLSKLRFVFIIQAIILASLYFTLHFAVLGLINILIIGLVVYLFNVTFQLYLIDLAKEYSPSARVFAASLFPVSVNLGIAAGSAFGGLVVTNIGLLHTGWMGGVLALAASILTFISYRFYRSK